MQEKKSDDDLSLLEKPVAPEIPKLPELTADEKKSDLLSLADLEKKEEPKLQDNAQLPILPKAELPNQNKPAEALPAVAQVAGAAANKVDPTYLDPKYAPIVVMSSPMQQGKDAVSGSSVAGVGYDRNIVSVNGDPIRSLAKSAVAIKTTYVEDRQNVIAQGKLLTAVLETAINTELPGFVRAIVSRDVYGEAGNDILISRGSRLFGTYSSEIVRGQGRVQINWTRLIRPDGVDLAISSFASDQFGRAGIQGNVDNRFTSVIANSILTSVLAVGVAAIAESLLGDNTQATTTTNPQLGATTTTAGATTQSIFNASRVVTDTVSRIVGEQLDSRPVITVPQGTRITVLVNSDMKIPSMKR